MPFWSTNARTSPASKSAGSTRTIALSRLASSKSLIASPLSTDTPELPSVYEVEPPVVVITGASFVRVIERLLVVAAESALPSFTLNSTAFDVAGFSEFDANVTERSAAWYVATVPVPDSVSTPVDGSVPTVRPPGAVMPSRSPDSKPDEIRTCALSRLTSSGSATVRRLSTATAAPFSS